MSIPLNPTLLSFALCILASCQSLDYSSLDHCDHCDLWGGENRIEAHEVTDPKIRKAIQATGTLLRGVSNPTFNSNDEVVLNLRGTLRDFYETEKRAFCPNVRFVEQPTLDRFCSGILIAPDLFAIAGHCFTESDVVFEADGTISCPEISVAFGFQTLPDGTSPNTVPERDYYSCESVAILENSQTSDDPRQDFALIRLNRPVTGRQPYQNISFAKPIPGAHITSLGFPEGLPLKIGTGEVQGRLITEKFIEYNLAEQRLSESTIEEREKYFSNYIHSNLPNFPGNSGGPLLNTTTGALLGFQDTASGKLLRFVKNNWLFGSTVSYEQMSKDELYYRYNPAENKQCIEAVDCEDEDIICATHARTIHIGEYKEVLETLGIYETNND